MTTRITAAALFIGAIVAANLLTAHYGFAHIAGVAVTAGTFAAGLSFIARDALQDAGGRRLVIAGIVAGATLSALFVPLLGTGGAPISPLRLAAASGVAFLLSETADMLVYTPLRDRGHRVTGWASSNVVGSLVDSALFLWLAGFPLAGFIGQASVKSTIGVLVPLTVAGLIGVRSAVLRNRVRPEGA